MSKFLSSEVQRQLLFGLSRSYRSPELWYSTVKYIFLSPCHECIQGEQRYPGLLWLQCLTTSDYLPRNTSLVGSVLVALYSKTNPMQRRGGAGGFRGVPASTTTCTLLKFISKFRTWAKVRLTWKWTLYMRGNEEWQVLYEPIIRVPVMLLII